MAWADAHEAPRGPTGAGSKRLPIDQKAMKNP
jgi:hypothetical protein